MSQRDTLHSLGVMDGTRGGDDSQRRHRKYTEKGLAYQLEVKCKRRSHVFKQLEKKTEYIRGALTQNISASEVKTEHAQWLTMYENFMYCCEEYVTLLDEQSQADDRVRWVSPMMAYISGFKQDIENWLRSASTDNMPAAKEQVKVRQQSDEVKSSVSGLSSDSKSLVAPAVWFKSTLWDIQLR